MTNYTWGSNTEIQLDKFLLVQTGTYRVQPLRPFRVVVNDNIIDRMHSATHGGKRLGISTVQGFASEVIQPQANVEGEVAIDQGWNSRRFRFMMRVYERHPFNLGAVTQRIFSGYTDHCDVSLGQNLAPDMRIYFNSELVINETIQPSENGPLRKVSVVSANQIISPVTFAGQTTGSAYHSRPVAHMIRPEDNFGLGQCNAVVDMLNQTGQFQGGVQNIIDTRTMVGEGGTYKYSMRRDTSPVRYLADNLTAWQHAVQESAMDSDGLNFQHTGGTSMLLGEAQAYAANLDIHANTFLASLKDHAGYMERGYITFADLCRLYPEAGRMFDVTHFSMDNGQSIRRVNFVEHSEHWMGADPVSIGASLLAQVVPSIMMDNYLRNIHFTAVNGMGHSQYVIDVQEQSVRSIIDGLPMQPYIQEFMRRIAVDILNSITRNNELPFQVGMMVDLMGDSVIDISLGNETLRRYIAPTFSDSLFTPMLTHDANVPKAISNDLIHLVTSVIPASGNHASISNLLQPQVVPTATANQPVQGTELNDYKHFGLL